MNEILGEVLIVVLLTVLNGFFSCSEIALISVRPAKMKELIEKGSKRAKIVQQLRANPENLFATLQIGISLITIIASAYAGSRIAEHLAIYVERAPYPVIAMNAYAISFVLIVALVSYFNLVLGELVPKSIGYRFANSFALLAAYPVWGLSKIMSPLVKGLTVSSNLILKPFQDSTSFAEARISEQEIRNILAEGREAGTIKSREHEIIENVFELSDVAVSKIMVPRTQITAFDIARPVDEIVQAAIESGYSRLPIYQGSINKIVGVLYTKKLLSLVRLNNQHVTLEDFLIPPYYVPNSMKIDTVLRKLQRKNTHMAFVTDEHGEIEGLVTLEDILEEIVGEIADETDEVNKSIVAHEEGYFLVSGRVSIVDFNKYFNSRLSENAEYATISGLILENLGRFPNVGDVVEHKEFTFLVKEKDLRTVTLLEVKRK